MAETIGLIAGEPPLPKLSAEQARRNGFRVVTAAVKGSAGNDLAGCVDIYSEFSLGEIGKAVRFFRKHGVKKAIMVGRVRHPVIFDLLHFDRSIPALLKKIKAKTTTSLLSAVIEFFNEKGIEFVDSTLFLKDKLVREGNYTSKITADIKLMADIDFGWEKAWGIATLDIGQTVCVKDRAVVAVEAMEGTDACIRRAFGIAGKGMTVIKVSRPDREMRFDVPVIGPATLDVLEHVNAAALVVEAERTLLLNEEALVSRAEKARILFMGKKT